MTYADSVVRTMQKRNDLQSLIRNGSTYPELVAARGRYIAALQVQLKKAKEEAIAPMTIVSIERELKNQLLEHQRILRQSNNLNKHGRYSRVGYSTIKELGLGMKSLINSIMYAKVATSKAEKKLARDNVFKSVVTNLKNMVKAPLVLTTRLLSTGLVATILFTPLNIAIGIAHAAWTCLDKNPPKYDGLTVRKMSQGFANIMGRLNTATKRM